MSRSIVWTNQFKKDYKLSIKRGLDIEILDNVIRTLAIACQLSIKTISWQAIGKDIVNVIFSLTGC